ncbi:MAG: hypothetical protein F2826_08250 [Actinobacteria bacterium]|nr:hypothetical protein [Actinomycetota bacterium]
MNGEFTGEPLAVPVRQGVSVNLGFDFSTTGHPTAEICQWSLTLGGSAVGLVGTSFYFDTSKWATVSASIPVNTWAKVGFRSGAIVIDCGSEGFARVPISFTVLPTANDDFLTGVSIEGGSYAVNDPKVTLNFSWKSTEYFDQVMLSNDGGFSASKRKIVDLTKDIVPWTLETQSSEKLPKTVYIRFHDALTDIWTVAMTDDIILDTIPPTISSVSVDGSRAKKSTLRISAKDNRTSVAQIMVASAKSGGKRVVVKYSTKVTLNMSVSNTKFVRVQDGAGNWSKWRRLA